MMPNSGNLSASAFMLNDEIHTKILAGKIIIQCHLQELQGRTAVFQGHKIEDGIDAILVATGYKPNFAYLDSSLQKGLFPCMFCVQISC